MFGDNVGRPLILSYQTAGSRILKPPFDARHANNAVRNYCHASSWDVGGSSAGVGWESVALICWTGELFGAAFGQLTKISTAYPSKTIPTESKHGEVTKHGTEQ